MIAPCADGDDLREVMRRFPSGVAVVTVDVGGTRLGQTVSALVSLSLEPPLVGISIARQAQLHELLREAGGFAVSLLAGGQEWLSQHFARSVPPIAMWHGVAHHEGSEGAPLLAGALGWLECRLWAEYPRATTRSSWARCWQPSSARMRHRSSTSARGYRALA